MNILPRALCVLALVCAASAAHAVCFDVSRAEPRQLTGVLANSSANGGLSYLLKLEAPIGVTAVPGATDRLRLMVEVRFSSRAIAAKVICGAHVDSSKWRPRNMAELPVLSI